MTKKSNFEKVSLTLTHQHPKDMRATVFFTFHVLPKGLTNTVVFFTSIFHAPPVGTAGTEPRSCACCETHTHPTLMHTPLRSGAYLPYIFRPSISLPDHVFRFPGSFFVTARVRSTREGNIYTWKCLSVHFGGGGGPRSRSGGVPGLRSGGVPGPGRGGPRSRGGTQSQVWGGTQSQVWRGYLVSGPGGYPVSVKGKFFDTRFGLIHVQTGKKILSRDPPPPTPRKGKNFWHQIWLDTCSDWQKKFLSREPPPPQ